MSIKREWIQDEARVKRDLIKLLRTEPRARWSDAIIAKYAGSVEGRVAVFRVFCAMEQSGELDELKTEIGATPSRKAAKTAILALAGLAIAFSSASADDHSRRSDRRPREHHNYIIERQQAGQVSGVPTSRRIIGKREIDIYRDGSMFEKNNYVGRSK